MTAFEIADALRVCLAAAFEGDTEIPAEICHRPGDQVPLNVGTAQDECCSGLAWVRVASVEPVTDFAQAESADFNACNVDQRITFELGVARCNPFGDASAGPSCATWTALALRMDQDRVAMGSAVCCLAASSALLEDQGVYRVRKGLWEPFPSSGLCAGGTLTVTVWMSCDEC